MAVETAYVQFAALLAAQPDVYRGNEGVKQLPGEASPYDNSNAARHNTLTASEEDRVAAAATPPFTL
jgi:hypothetical protein